MFRLIRTMISLAFVGGLVWLAFTVQLGRKSFAEHVDSIGRTRAAQDLFEGARDTVNPALEEAKERVLGEYVEAPTHISPSLSVSGMTGTPGITNGRTPRGVSESAGSTASAPASRQ
ncbi:MAG: hypothetical protein V3V08_02960 [Nannocystaceae bacterium]